eukprot:GGOE01018424.1.p1 GENE.GGOE01018424.1~~GGOE01018424.1.p1  ORF type:complete len:683 (-),score=135.93 GGOE01018424.1:407-2215(-)
MGGLVSQWQRCTNKWGGASSPSMALHLEWQRASFDADRFRADIAGVLSLHSGAQVEVTQHVPSQLQVASMPLFAVQDLLRVDFLLRNVQEAHVAPLVEGLRHALKHNTAFRATWRVVGPLTVMGEAAPSNFWQRLREEILPGADHTLLNAAEARLGTETCRMDSLPMRAMVRESDKQQMVYNDDSAELKVLQNPDLTYVHKQWEVVVGQGVLEDPFTPSTMVRGLGIGRNVFLWLAIASGCNNGTNDNCCFATLATVSVTRVVAPSPIPSITVRQSWWMLDADHMPCKHCTGLWCVSDGSAVVGEPTRPSTLATNLSLGTVVFKWIIFYTPTAVTEQTVEVRREPGWDPSVPVAATWPLNDRIQTLTLEVEELEAQVQVRETMVKEAHALALQAQRHALTECQKVPLCPEVSVQECVCPIEDVEPPTCPPYAVPHPEPCPVCAACPECPECVRCPVCSECPVCPDVAPTTCPSPSATSEPPPSPNPRGTSQLTVLWPAVLLTALLGLAQNLFWRYWVVRPLQEQSRQSAERLAGIMATLRGSMEDHPFDSSDESLAQLMKEFVDGNAAAFREYSEKWKGSAIANVDGDGAVHRETEAGDVIG